MVVVPLSKLWYPYPISTVFPERMVASTSTEEPLSPRHVDAQKDDGESEASHLSLVDYRYIRFVLNPDTGLFVTIRFVFGMLTLPEGVD
jgi:cation-transporting P-type ATPase 13A2